MARYADVEHTIKAVTATTTGQPINIDSANKVVLVGNRADNAGGTTAFSATVSVDGTNYVAYNKWIDNVTNTNGEQLTRVATKSIAAANGTIFLTMSPEDGFRWIKVTVTETTDGTHSAWIWKQYD